ncbi:MAG: hypothetical protein ACXWPM_03550 [Bdellovibrionota bacterium]
MLQELRVRFLLFLLIELAVFREGSVGEILILRLNGLVALGIAAA